SGVSAAPSKYRELLQRSRKMKVQRAELRQMIPLGVLQTRTVLAGPTYLFVALACALHSLPGSGIERLRQILRARLFEISRWRGTASTAPVRGLVQRECARPS